MYALVSLYLTIWLFFDTEILIYVVPAILNYSWLVYHGLTNQWLLASQLMAIRILFFSPLLIIKFLQQLDRLENRNQKWS